ncbi:MAG: hypothetical protein FWG84_02965 [Bacteroidales bacterium]|nr:hypothetical protein [Bacteroidales bacterium]
MKKLLLAAVLTFTVGSIFAQSGLQLGIKVGGNFSTVLGDDADFGIEIGIIGVKIGYDCGLWNLADPNMADSNDFSHTKIKPLFHRYTTNRI